MLHGEEPGRKGMNMLKDSALSALKPTQTLYLTYLGFCKLYLNKEAQEQLQPQQNKWIG